MRFQNLFASTPSCQPRRFFSITAAAVVLLVLSGSLAVAQDAPIDFQRDIRPILSDTCYKCHGPETKDRKAGLRLDTQEGLLESSVVPGDLDSSELYQRTISNDEGDMMPPPDSGRKLTEEQKRLIKRWIEEGAQWQGHWSLTPAKKAEIPAVDQAYKKYIKNPIDNFVVARLSADKIQPKDEAKRTTLIRRVSFDLTGLPPSPETLQSYLDNNSENWYEQLVDELLASPAYGEHMGRYWLDAARYGDTHGLHLDNYREMWPYRDWVVKAFNDNMSYRDFTIVQLAGDMLENPTQSQLIGSGFNRAHITTNEGGAIKEEVYVRNVVDRVSTTGTVFMGLTVGCAQCHDHKFDPISQKEFYQLFAYFNNLTDPPMDKNIKDPAPVLRVMDSEATAKLRGLTEVFDEAETALQTAVDEFEYLEPNEAQAVDAPDEASGTNPDSPREFLWVDSSNFPAGHKPGGSFEPVFGKDVPAITNQRSRKQSGNGTIQHFFTDATVPILAEPEDILFADVYLDPNDPPTEVMLQFNDGNWEHRVFWGKDVIAWGDSGKPSRFIGGALPESGKWVRLEVKAKDVGFEKPSNINGFAFTQNGGTAFWDTAGIVSKKPQIAGFTSLAKWEKFAEDSKFKSVPEDVKKAIQQPEEKRTEEQSKAIHRYFLLKINRDTIGKFSDQVAARDQAKKAMDDFEKSLPTTLISKEASTIKDAYVLERGEYDQRRDKVQRKTPAALPPFAGTMPNNRLGFAQWLTTGEHPLTARVAVNRMWQQVFGTGIVKTSEDFGSQGENPSHPELLDWLAVDFVKSDWDMKRLFKTMVMSATYRQSSAASTEAYTNDPENRQLARGSRYRLDAEMLRDQALAVGGLLRQQLGGPSVKPPQPDGLWFAVGYSGSNTVRFKADQGDDKIYRRSLYSFWKRTSPPPQLTTFDAPSREECRVRRERTNTPLQALLLMNEPQYLQAAQGLAQLAVDQEVDTDESRIAFMFFRAIGYQPRDTQLKVLLNNLARHREEFKASPRAARTLLQTGVTVEPKKADMKNAPDAKTNLTAPDTQPDITDEEIELASLTMVGNLIMNTDEFLNKN